MPSLAIIVARAIAPALLALAPVGGLAAQAQPAGVPAGVVVAQASDEEEDADAAPLRRRGVVTDEPDAAVEDAEQAPLPRQGASRRLDPFDADDTPSRSKPASSSVAATNPGEGVVVCEAGCDGPRGMVVYKK
jgi:hypothetical protein